VRTEKMIQQEKEGDNLKEIRRRRREKARR